MTLAHFSESYELREERLRFIPEHFERGVASVSTASELDVSPWASGLSAARTPLWRFRSPHVVILSSKPVTVKVHRGEALFFAENENLGIFATGESRNEAINAFCQDLVHFYEHYKRLDWDRVTGEAMRLKKIYENLFQEVAA
ncbi:MAG: hypothetical protein IMF11_06120 [Proteobacteria bacterium]|nr:hypothetical protein [Pseudomonadota bacterium]MCK4486773.1 hypothetical protein [Desulfobacterales bacterium]